MNVFNSVFPLIAAWSANKRLPQIDDDKFKEKRSEWKTKLKNQIITKAQIENITHNIYVDENHRVSTIENKASWLLIGTSISISVITILLFQEKLSPIIELFFILSIINFVATGISIYHTTKLGEKYIFVPDSAFEKLENGNYKNIVDIAAELAIVECNYNLIIKKTNLVYAAQKHFIYGFFFILMSFVISLLYQWVCNILGG